MLVDLEPVLLTLALLLGTVLFLRRFGGGAALEQLERANRVLERRVRELESHNAALTLEVAQLRTRTDIVEAVKPLAAALLAHDERTATDDARMIELLGKIAGTLEYVVRGD